MLERLRQLLLEMGIVKGDILFVSSDVLQFLADAQNLGEMPDPKEIILLFEELVGPGGTVLFPTYNWDFCKGKTFDYKKSGSKTGALTKLALKMPGFKRTRHPIYSFAVWGRDRDYLCSLDYRDSFGPESVFAWLFKQGAKQLFFNVHLLGGFTAYHCAEEAVGVPYRFVKDFTSFYIDEEGQKSLKTYSMYVLYLELNSKPRTYFNELEERLLNKGLIKKTQLEKSFLMLLPLSEARAEIEAFINERKDEYGTELRSKEGEQAYDLIRRLFYICRSITGEGVRETFRILKEDLPALEVHEVKTGTQVLDWTVPKEWNIKDAWIKDSSGKKIIDFKDCNLHVLGYSVPVHEKLPLKELLTHVYTLPNQPDLIPYVTSYYQENWGFCMSENQKQALKDGIYEVCIDSTLEDGSLTYADLVIKGREDKEILFDTYTCHPSLANDNLSGIAVAVALIKWLSARDNRYTYRFVFGPETIGAISYLQENVAHLKEKVIAGFVLTCVGDNNGYSYVPSAYGNTLADKAALNAIRVPPLKFAKWGFMNRGSNERQYCSPNVGLPVCTVMRTRYGAFPEYHTSGDNLDFVNALGLQGSINIYKKIIVSLEHNHKYRVVTMGEPQLGKRGLYPPISDKDQGRRVYAMKGLLAYADGTNDLIDISNLTGISIWALIQNIDKLLKEKLIEQVD